MKLTNIDLDTLRTLVVANDLGGYGQAGTRLGRTPSAISLQMKRLQADVGAPLFRKVGRSLALTEAGDIVLRYGRRMLALNDELLDTVRGAALSGEVRLGCSQDFAETILPDVLTRFSALYPRVVIEVRIEGNGALADAIESRQLDMALVVGQADKASALIVGAVELVWIAGDGFRVPADQPLPLVMLGPQCAFRKMALGALEGIGQAWRIAATSPSLAGLWATASAGLGITARSALGLPAGLIHGEALFSLPELGAFPVCLLRAENIGPAAERLHQLVAEAAVEKLVTR